MDICFLKNYRFENDSAPKFIPCNGCPHTLICFRHSKIRIFTLFCLRGFWLRFLFQRGNRLFYRTTRTTPDGLKGIFIDRKVHNKSNTKIRISSTNVNLSLKHYDTNVAHKNTRNWTIRIKVKQVVLLTSSPLITWMFRFQWAAVSSRSPWRSPHWKYEQLKADRQRPNKSDVLDNHTKERWLNNLPLLNSKFLKSVWEKKIRNAWCHKEGK